MATSKMDSRLASLEAEAALARTKTFIGQGIDFGLLLPHEREWLRTIFKRLAGHPVPKPVSEMTDEEKRQAYIDRFGIDPEA